MPLLALSLLILLWLLPSVLGVIALNYLFPGSPTGNKK